MGSAVLVALVVIAAEGPGSRPGSPGYWPWLLTGLQVAGLWGADAAHWWGWPLGPAMQPPWIAYAVITGQLGSVPGCLVSGAVQTVTVLPTAGDQPAGVPASSTHLPFDRPSGKGRRAAHLEVS